MGTNVKNEWGKVSIWFHWIMAFLIIGMLGVGVYMTGLPPSDTKWMLYGLHKTFGVILLILVLIRLIWRLSHSIPDLPPLSPLHYFMAKVSPWVLYFLMLIMPLSGYVMSVAGGHPIAIFNWVTLPDLIGPNKPLAALANQTHGIAGNIFIVVLFFHFSAALYHHWILKNDILKRMLGK